VLRTAEVGGWCEVAALLSDDLSGSASEPAV